MKVYRFRRKVADIIQPHHDDYFLVRWLRARSWDADAAEKMIRQSMKWRQQWEVDTVLKNWEPTGALAIYHPSGTCGYDKGGAPVVVVPFGTMDVVGLLHSSSRQDMIKCTIKILEYNLDLAYKSGARQVTVVFDMEGFNLRDYTSRLASELVITLIQMYEANYPEILKCCFIINAPSVFAIAFNIVKRFLNEYTLSKIQIHKHDPKKWKKAILEIVDPDSLPKWYGGNLVDPDGNPKYTTKIKQGGKVPKSYYVKNIPQDELNLKSNSRPFVTSAIKKGGKLVLDFIVADQGCTLKWNFRTDGHDIKFGITLKDEEGVESPVVRHRRVASHQMDESGSIACQAPATYTIMFDNSYSMFRSKKIHYCIYVASPIEELLEEDLVKNGTAL